MSDVLVVPQETGFRAKFGRLFYLLKQFPSDHAFRQAWRENNTDPIWHLELALFTGVVATVLLALVMGYHQESLVTSIFAVALLAFSVSEFRKSTDFVDTIDEVERLLGYEIGIRDEIFTGEHVHSLEFYANQAIQRRALFVRYKSQEKGTEGLNECIEDYRNAFSELRKIGLVTDDDGLLAFCNFDKP